VSRIALGALISLVLACTTTNGVEASDATAPGGSDRASQQSDVVEPTGVTGAAVMTGPGPGADPNVPPSNKPTQPYNCQAPLVVIEEVSRLLTVAGTHATRSAACVDGPGQRVTFDEILVCPLAPDGTRRPFGVTYRVTTWDEGGRQVCPGGKCPPVVPEQTFHRVDVAFRPEAGKYVIEPPKSLPGLPLETTPITKAHDGDCYGPSPAFEPRPIPLQ
jgi:hypothetical protein